MYGMVPLALLHHLKIITCDPRPHQPCRLHLHSWTQSADQRRHLAQNTAQGCRCALSS